MPAINSEHKKQAADFRKFSPESLSFPKNACIFFLVCGELSAPSGRPGLPTRTEYREYSTVCAKSIQHFLNGAKFFRTAGQKKMQSAQMGTLHFGDFVSAESAVIAHPVSQLFQPFQGDGGLGQGLHGDAH